MQIILRVVEAGRTAMKFPLRRGENRPRATVCRLLRLNLLQGLDAWRVSLRAVSTWAVAAAWPGLLQGKHKRVEGSMLSKWGSWQTGRLKSCAKKGKAGCSILVTWHDSFQLAVRPIMKWLKKNRDRRRRQYSTETSHDSTASYYADAQWL